MLCNDKRTKNNRFTNNNKTGTTLMMPKYQKCLNSKRRRSNLFIGPTFSKTILFIDIMQFLVRRATELTDRARVTTTGRTGMDGQMTGDDDDGTDDGMDGQRATTATMGHDETRRDGRTED